MYLIKKNNNLTNKQKEKKSNKTKKQHTSKQIKPNTKGYTFKKANGLLANFRQSALLKYHSTQDMEKKESLEKNAGWTYLWG